MSYDIENDWTTAAGLRAVVIRTDGRRGNRCGYVGVPSTHPLHGVGYSTETDRLKPVADDEPVGKRGVITLICAGLPGAMNRPEMIFDVHGSLTYSGGEGYPVDGALWWFGFDAAHHGDDEDGGRSLEYMTAECERLAQQLIDRVAVTQ